MRISIDNNIFILVDDWFYGEDWRRSFKHNNQEAVKVSELNGQRKLLKFEINFSLAISQSMTTCFGFYEAEFETKDWMGIEQANEPTNE